MYCTFFYLPHSCYSCVFIRHLHIFNRQLFCTTYYKQNSFDSFTFKSNKISNQQCMFYHINTFYLLTSDHNMSNGINNQSTWPYDFLIWPMHISALDELFCCIMVRRLADLITTVDFHTASDALNDIVTRKSAIKRQLWAKDRFNQYI